MQYVSAEADIFRGRLVRTKPQVVPALHAGRLLHRVSYPGRVFRAAGGKDRTVLESIEGAVPLTQSQTAGFRSLAAFGDAQALIIWQGPCGLPGITFLSHVQATPSVAITKECLGSPL